MELPEKVNPSIPLIEQFPARYVPVFTRGCTTISRGYCGRHTLLNCGRLVRLPYRHRMQKKHAETRPPEARDHPERLTRRRSEGSLRFIVKMVI
jgi:hypothetical protein